MRSREEIEADKRRRSEAYMEELLNRFRAHELPEHAQQDAEAIRFRLYETAKYLAVRVPDCRERAIVMTKLEEAMFWANAGIARQHPGVET